MVERTVILVKHDGVQRGLVGEVVKRFEQKGLKIVAMKMIAPTKELAKKQYKLTPAWVKKLAVNTRKEAKERGIKIKETNTQIAKRVQKWLMDYLTEGPVVAILFEGYHAIDIGRKIVGHAEARQAEIGSIRGDFSTDSYDLADRRARAIRNIVHASGNKQEAKNEEKLWFKKSEIHKYKIQRWEVMH